MANVILINDYQISESIFMPAGSAGNLQNGEFADLAAQNLNADIYIIDAHIIVKNVPLSNLQLIDNN